MEQPARVFIVEDEAIVAGDIADTLRSLGYTVAGMARSGEAALDSIPGAHPDLILMDIHLAGEIDGIQAAEQIRLLQNLPVIFLTAYADKPLIERARKAEPYGYIIKPYDERGLESTIEMALYKHRMERRLAESEDTMRMLIDASQDLLYLIGSDGRFLVVNNALADRAGTTTGELAGTSAYDLVGKSILSPRMACWQLDPNGEKRLAFEEELNRNWFDVTIYPVYDRRGVAGKFAVNVRNITSRKQAEEMVKNNAGYFQTIIEDASEIVVVLNPDGSLARQSPSFKKALGYPLPEDMKKSFFDYLALSEWQHAKQVFSEILIHPGMAKPVRLKFERADGTFCTLKGILSNLSDNPFVGNVVFNGWLE